MTIFLRGLHELCVRSHGTKPNGSYRPERRRGTKLTTQRHLQVCSPSDLAALAQQVLHRCDQVGLVHRGTRQDHPHVSQRADARGCTRRSPTG